MTFLEQLKSELTDHQASALEFGTPGIVDENRIGAALARKDITCRQEEYVPKVPSRPLSVGHVRITYHLTTLGEDLRDLIQRDDPFHHIWVRADK